MLYPRVREELPRILAAGAWGPHPTETLLRCAPSRHVQLETAAHVAQTTIPTMVIGEMNVKVVMIDVTTRADRHHLFGA